MSKEYMNVGKITIYLTTVLKIKLSIFNQFHCCLMSNIVNNYKYIQLCNEFHYRNMSVINTQHK